MVTAEQHSQVEAVLRYMLIGQRFCRVHFYGTPILYLWGPTPHGIGPWFSNTDDDAMNIWVESRWELFETVPSRWPRSQDDLPAHPIEDLVRAACSLRDNDIVDVRLGAESPHLILTFDNGRILFINGHHDQYESWQLYAGGSDLLIVAVPGDNLSMWLPENFKQDPESEPAT